MTPTQTGIKPSRRAKVAHAKRVHSRIKAKLPQGDADGMQMDQLLQSLVGSDGPEVSGDTDTDIDLDGDGELDSTDL